MARQDILLLATVWALLLSPALCEGGLLAHPCHCDEHEACPHEADCATDPCVDVVRPDDDATPQFAPVVESQQPAAATVAPADPSKPCYPQRWSCPPSDEPPAGRPYPDSDLPLLI